MDYLRIASETRLMKTFRAWPRLQCYDACRDRV